MKNSIIIALIAVLFASCGFQQRKYTHGYWPNGVSNQEKTTLDRTMHFPDTVSNWTLDAACQANASNGESFIFPMSEKILEDVVTKEDTITPQNGNSDSEEDFMPSKPNADKKNEGQSSKNAYGTANDPCYDPYREELTKEVSDNVLWGVVSLLLSALYGVGFISGTIYFFKTIKTHKKLKELNTNGQYQDLKRMNFAALLANGSIFATVALMVLFLLFLVVLALTGNL